MKITELIKALQKTLEKEGDISVTCTATTLDGTVHSSILPDVWESTVENLVIQKGGVFGGKRVRLYM